MSVTSALARDTPVTAKMIETGSWNALKSHHDTRGFGEVLECTDVHDEEEHGHDQRRDEELRFAEDAACRPLGDDGQIVPDRRSAGERCRWRRCGGW